MKRSWLGLGLLLILLGLGVGSTWAMVRLHEPVEEYLKKAAVCALEEDWEQADVFFRRAQGEWERFEHLRACFADHTPVEEIDGEFEMLDVYRLARENSAFAAGCMELARKTAAVGEAHEFVWWNLL